MTAILFRLAFAGIRVFVTATAGGVSEPLQFRRADRPTRINVPVSTEGGLGGGSFSQPHRRAVEPVLGRT